MRKIRLIIVLIFIVKSFFAQDKGECISGNCENGKGVYKTWMGYTYTGYFKNGKYNGPGFYDMLEGNYYEGSFKDGKFDGYGVRVSSADACGMISYIGFWKNGRYHGFGVETFKWKTYTGVYNECSRNGEFKVVEFDAVKKMVYIKTGTFVKDSEEGEFKVVDSNGKHYTENYIHSIKQK